MLQNRKDEKRECELLGVHSFAIRRKVGVGNLRRRLRYHQSVNEEENRGGVEEIWWIEREIDTLQEKYSQSDLAQPRKAQGDKRTAVEESVFERWEPDYRHGKRNTELSFLRAL